MPKSTHVGLNILSLGVFDAIAHFNYGSKATLDVLKQLNIEPCFYTTKTSDILNKCRKRKSVYKMSESCKRRRRVVRRLGKRKQDKNIEEEGTSYEAGRF